MNIQLDDLAKNGFILFERFFEPSSIEAIQNDAKEIFARQLYNSKIANSKDVLEDESLFNESLFKLFEIDRLAFINCGKQIQHLISLHRLAISEKVTEKLNQLGVSFPNISTRPVLFFNSPKLAEREVYHTVFPHQDWRSMQGSLDSIVLWLPLIDIDKSLGALEVIPGSHRWGLVSKEFESGFGKVELSDKQKNLFQSIEVKRGDALFFSSFLVHQSGINSTNKIRWSAHFRYNNLDEPSFIRRKFAHAYIYKPIEELITPDFPSQSDINMIFPNK